jgi:hypothetical protein
MQTKGAIEIQQWYQFFLGFCGIVLVIVGCLIALWGLPGFENGSIIAGAGSLFGLLLVICGIVVFSHRMKQPET